MISTALTMASKRVILTLEQRVNVMKKLDAGRSCRAVAQETGCGKTQITRIKQDRRDIMNDWQSGGRATIKIKRRTTPYEELNCLVWEWFCIARSSVFPASLQATPWPTSTMQMKLDCISGHCRIGQWFAR